MHGPENAIVEHIWTQEERIMFVHMMCHDDRVT